jgi:hypothetical protein
VAGIFILAGLIYFSPDGSEYEYADDVAVYSAKRYSRMCVPEVERTYTVLKFI